MFHLVGGCDLRWANGDRCIVMNEEKLCKAKVVGYCKTDANLLVIEKYTEKKGAIDRKVFEYASVEDTYPLYFFDTKFIKYQSKQHGTEVFIVEVNLYEKCTK